MPDFTPPPEPPLPDSTTQDIARPELGVTLTQSMAGVSVRIGERVGPYNLLEAIGEGGFGVVYRAEQREPFRREVALKLLKPGMDSRQVLSRFEAERQALAYMDHPCVAKVFDGGATDDGRPYFVMEFVKGEPLTAFCDKNRLSVSERVTLFIAVCEAVQHAHTKGVVHRDLKPGNILVAYDASGKPQPKVIDFGVAKALHQPMTERTLFTERGQLLGTPEYMSPEQAEMTGRDIDTRSDVYSLGVTLYELLTGVRPFESETLRRAGLAEIVRIICETEPPRPSTRLASLLSSKGAPDSAAKIVQARRAEPRSLSKALREDRLDWIVMKCLEKDRARRYETANALAIELRRYLASEPVMAGPPSVVYRARKFVRKHRGATLAVVTVMLSLALGLFGTITQARAAWNALAQATAAQSAAEAASKSATREAEGRRAFELLIQNTLLGLGPLTTRRDITLRELLDLATARFQGTPDTAARALLSSIVGENYLALGAYDEAQRNLDAALNAGGDASLSPDQRRETLIALARVAYESRSDIAAGQEYLRRIPDAASAGPRAIAEIWQAQAGLYFEAGDLKRAAQLFDEAYRELVAAGVGANETGPLIHDRGYVLAGAGEFATAEALYRPAVGWDRQDAPDSPFLASSANNLAIALAQQGLTAAAEPFLREAEDIRRRKVGDRSAPVANSLGGWAQLYLASGNAEAAERSAREAFAIQVEHFGTTRHLAPAFSRLVIAASLAERGDRDGAASELQAALADYRALTGGIPSFAPLFAYSARITAAEQAGRPADAQALCERALALAREIGHDASPPAAHLWRRLATSLRAVNRAEDAVAAALRAVEIQESCFGTQHPAVSSPLLELAAALEAKGDDTGCRAALERAVVLREALQPPSGWYVAEAEAALGRHLCQTGDRAAGQRLLNAARTRLEVELGPEDPRTVRAAQPCE